MEQQSLPVFYRKPVALDSKVHAGLTLGPSPNGHRFAASAQSVPLAAAEFYDAARQFPIIFSQAADNRIVPLALLGLKANENLFVDRQGAWIGSYIPAYVRRYPFITTEAGGEKVVVCFDEAYDGFGQEGGALLFEGGEPSTKLKDVQRFLNDYFAQLKQTEQFGAMLAQAGLLKPIDLQANLVDGRSYALKGVLVVDEQKLSLLQTEDVVRLFHAGTLALIHAHLLSLRNLSTLMDLKVKAGNGHNRSDT